VRLESSVIISVIASIVVAIVAYRGALRGIRTQIDARVLATQRDERAEHSRWLRDRAADAFLAALDLTEGWYDHRRQLYGYEVAREMGEMPRPVTKQDADLAYRQAAARLELFGDSRLRKLFDEAREAHHTAVYDLELMIRGDVPESEGAPVPDMSDLHDHLDAAIRADEELRAALVEAIQERPSLRVDLAEPAMQIQLPLADRPNQIKPKSPPRLPADADGTE
jgi:hypothetical protein